MSETRTSFLTCLFSLEEPLTPAIKNGFYELEAKRPANHRNSECANYHKIGIDRFIGCLIVGYRSLEQIHCGEMKGENRQRYLSKNQDVAPIATNKIG